MWEKVRSGDVYDGLRDERAILALYQERRNNYLNKHRLTKDIEAIKAVGKEADRIIQDQDETSTK